MPRHSNAIGYLIELRDQEAAPWFSKICDLAISSDGSSLQKHELESILEILFGEKNYEPSSATPLAPSTTTTTAPPQSAQDYLINLSDFNNFKKLSDSLTVEFKKRITVIFGCNGSGKTSLCEAIKILANPNTPKTPISNIRKASNEPCSFSYQFENDSTPTIWDSTQSCGLFSDRIKFYDSTVAVQNVTEPVTPEKAVKIEPFRLEVFSFAGKFIRELRSHLNQLLMQHREQVSQNVELIKIIFKDLLISNEQAITNLSESNCDELEKLFESYTHTNTTDASEYENEVATFTKIKQARNEDGLRLQKTELKLLLEFGRQIKKFKKLVQDISLKSVKHTAVQLSSKQELHKILAEQITPENIDPTDFQEFIDVASRFFNFESPGDEFCPFCRRPFDEASLQIVKAYHEFLVSTVGQDIKKLQAKLTGEYSNLEKVKAFTLPDFDDTALPLSQELLSKITNCINENNNLIPDKVEKLKNLPENRDCDLTDLKEPISVIAKEVLQRYRAIKLSSSSEDKFKRHCEKLELKIKSFEYKICFENNYEQLKNLMNHIKLCSLLENLAQSDDFPTILRKITNKNKEAYKELVVAKFERILDEEYQKMSGLKMSDFGISLMSTGSDQSVTVDTKIGDEPIHRVLSEGEQKIHALALFFGESSVSKQDIIVFDDPVTSFDYNYSSSYAERLRDFTLDNPITQIIVLTHNWDFYVHLQLILNQSGLNQHASIQVLEQCAMVEEYTEKIDDLRQEIDLILAVHGEPSYSEKERLSGQLRRLIESIINKHVFNGERHQFKQKTMTVSVFDKFTKVVPLVNHEALKLRDMYRNVSVPEHDDPRNYYSTKTKAHFQKWYSDLCEIENAIVMRRP